MIKDRYHLILVVGNAENGKTTWMARHMKRELSMKKAYTKGFSNIMFKDSPEITFTNYAGIRRLEAEDKTGVPHTIVGIDQLHKYIPSRRSGSKENVEFGDTLVESRQHGFDIVGTTWAMSKIDDLYRKFVELIVLAEKTAHGFKYTYQEPDSVRPMMQITLPFHEAASKVWPYYDTTELVRDDSLTKIAHLRKDERDEMAKELAIYKPCGKMEATKVAA